MKYPAVSVLFLLLISTANVICHENPFEVFKKKAMSENPVREAEHRIGYGAHSIQPYYLCDNAGGNSSLPISAWHYSCKQACREDNERTHVHITRARWNYIGKDISVYKVLANEVCYTSHENVWGYCTQSQVSRPVPVTEIDKDTLPASYFKANSKIAGVSHVINSSPAVCSYLSDNVQCAKDYIITYRTGVVSKRSYYEDAVLNIYGDGIRTDPGTGHLYNSDAAWYWNPEDVSLTTDCGWQKLGDATCKITATSEIMSCPDIGYHYNIHSLLPQQTCIGEVYDIDGPAPFLYAKKQLVPNRTETLNNAKKDKGDADVNMIIGINSALDGLEETYCESSCDLFSRSMAADDDYILDTPIGNWRLTGHNSSVPLLTPCKPTATWKLKSPTTICHGKNHLLVEDSATKHTSSWDVEKEYIVAREVCNTDNTGLQKDLERFRDTISKNNEIVFRFWTGDVLHIRPPYNKTEWTKDNRTLSVSPGWFSKVELTKDMLQNPTDLSRMLTDMMTNVKQEVRYNETHGRSVRMMLVDEMINGAAEIGGSIWYVIIAVLGSIPKFLLLIVLAIFCMLLVKTMVSYKRARGLSSVNVTKNVTFADIDDDGILSTPLTYPSAPTRRSRSRSSKLAKELNML